MRTKLTAFEKQVWKAVENRDLKAFKKALASGGGFSQLPSAASGDGVLKCAMERRADEIALYLLDNGQPINREDANLIWAVLVRRPDIVQRFIKLGADVNARSIMGTPLSIAAAQPRSMLPGSQEDLLKIMEILVDAGADPNAGAAMMSPLYDAVAKDKPAAAKFLIEAGARIDDVDELVGLAKDNGNEALAALIRETAKRPKRRSLKKPSGPAAADPDVTKLESLCGTKASPFEGFDGAISLHVDSRSKFNIEKVQPAFMKRGRFIFFLDSASTRVVMLRANDKFEAVAAIGTSAPNFELANADVVKWLRELDATDPFILTGIGFDFLRGKFLKKVKNPKDLAKRMYEFCPDIFEQGVDTPEAFAKELQTSRDLFFWWD